MSRAHAGGVSQPRIIAPGATTMVTKRTTERKGFWAAWHPEVSLANWYSVGLAVRDNHVAIHLIHLGELPVNHGHLLATPSEANLPAFVGQVHSESSKAPIVKRDRRKGRPAAAHGKHGADPPA